MKVSTQVRRSAGSGGYGSYHRRNTQHTSAARGLTNQHALPHFDARDYMLGMHANPYHTTTASSQPPVQSEFTSSRTSGESGFGLKPKNMKDNMAKRNERERNRVKMVNMAFERLRQRIPWAESNPKMSKVDTLRAALEYIRYMQNIIDECDSRIPMSGYPRGLMEPIVGGPRQKTAYFAADASSGVGVGVAAAEMISRAGAIMYSEHVSEGKEVIDALDSHKAK